MISLELGPKQLEEAKEFGGAEDDDCLLDGDELVQRPYFDTLDHLSRSTHHFPSHNKHFRSLYPARVRQGRVEIPQIDKKSSGEKVHIMRRSARRG